MSVLGIPVELICCGACSGMQIRKRQTLQVFVGLSDTLDTSLMHRRRAGKAFTGHRRKRRAKDVGNRVQGLQSLEFGSTAQLRRHRGPSQGKRGRQETEKCQKVQILNTSFQHAKTCTQGDKESTLVDTARARRQERDVVRGNLNRPDPIGSGNPR